MSITALHKLDNPVWHALAETHKGFSIVYDDTHFYSPEYSPFGAFTGPHDTSPALDEYAALTPEFFIVGDKPAWSNKLQLLKELVCLQMVASGPINIPITETIVPLNGEYEEALLQLVTEVFPGYFKEKTSQLGHYYGIFRDSQLVAVTGERMKMDDCTEVSAVVTYPDHAGQGYAKQLMAYTVNNIIEQNKMPFLHVAKDNAPAIALYTKLGFTTRREMSFWHLTKAQ